MPPQKLSRINNKADVQLITAAAFPYPDLAAIAMSVISRWAHVDAEFMALATSFLKAEHNVVSSMLNALAGAEARRAAIEAAARAALDGDDFALFESVMKKIKPSRNRRNEYAHHLWACSHAIPNALLIVNPSDMIFENARLAAAHSAFVSWAENAQSLAKQGREPPAMPDIPTLPRIAHDKVQVYRKADIEADAREAAYAWELALALRMSLMIGKTAGMRVMLALLLERGPFHDKDAIFGKTDTA